MSGVSGSLRGKFLKKVTQEGECHVWHGAKSMGIYCPFLARRVPVRDIAYFIAHGSWPLKGLRPNCGNAMCVNPNHFDESNRYGRPRLADDERRSRKAARQRAWRQKKTGVGDGQGAE